LGVSQVWLSKKLGLSQAAISLSLARERQIASLKNYEIGNLLTDERYIFVEEK
jgi:hypothetical protein